MPALMTNHLHIAKLAMTTRRVSAVSLDTTRNTCMVRIDPPSGDSASWPANVVALRCIPYDAALGMRGLVQR
jgi:hypothetical protein